MFLIIGLGNPGEKYVRTRHNAGFLMLDEIRKAWDFPEFTFETKFNAEMTEGVSPFVIPSEVEGSRNATKNKLLLIRPQTFMNNSGEAVQKILSFYKLTPDDIIVIHDDLDINLGKYKIATNSSSAGHNGVQDIIDKLGTQTFKRIRIGIGKENSEGAIECRLDAHDFVLQNFTEEELEKIKKISSDILNELQKLL